MRFTGERAYPRILGRLPGAKAASGVRRALVMAGLLTCVASTAAAAPMRFGFDVAATPTAMAAGMPVTYGSMWAGSWNQRWGWDGIRSQLNAAKASGVTPVVQWWYWGDDISPQCVESGCWDARQGVTKDKATWYRLSNELADLVVATMGPGSNAVIVVETEFNKNGIESYEPFDGYLTDHAGIFHARGLSVVVGFGNWGQSLWPTFDRAAGAADMLGMMVLQSSIREASTYMSGPDLLIAGASQLQAMFGKPCFVTDFAFSSYPEPSYADRQETVVSEIFARMPELKAAGVQGMVWRMLKDDPSFDTSNYHGMAERYWGLLHADGSQKRAFATFRNGMLAESAAPTPAVPANLTATAGDGKATLSWTNAGTASGYKVKSSTTQGGPYQTLATVTGTSYVASGLVNGVRYFFTVAANTPTGESANSNEATAVPAAVAPPANVPGGVNVWWPVNGATLSGIQPFKALLENNAGSTYRMYWQVDNGARTLMPDVLTDGPHKEVQVDVTDWNWRGAGPYVLTFIAESTTGQVLAQRNVTINVISLDMIRIAGPFKKTTKASRP